MTEPDDLYDDPDFRRWRQDIKENLIPKLNDSAFTMSLVPEGETDIKFALELGLSIMMDKPILAVVRPGSKVPRKLAKVVDRFVEVDLNDSVTDADKAKLAKAINDTMEEIHGTEA